MKPFITLALFALVSCAHTPDVVIHDESRFSTRDYLHTAMDALAAAETDTEGHRVRAQLETRAALSALTDRQSRAQAVTYDGPPTLEVALRLLEHCETSLASTPGSPVLEHTRKAAQEVRLALVNR